MVSRFSSAFPLHFTRRSPSFPADRILFVLFARRFRLSCLFFLLKRIAWINWEQVVRILKTSSLKTFRFFFFNVRKNFLPPSFDELFYLFLLDYIQNVCSLIEFFYNVEFSRPRDYNIIKL